MPARNNRYKTMELHSKRFLSELHHKRRGHIKHQSTKAKYQNYKVTNHTRKHSSVLRPRSVRRDASFHISRPFSNRLMEACEGFFRSKNQQTCVVRFERSLRKPHSPLESPVTRSTKKEHEHLAL